ncbi:MAG: HRDC domain-containing protein [Phycisphaerae bacterium]|nr:HRDC domain-containing protein [Phycisphaerae bacterium]
MQFRFFSIDALHPEQGQEELNRFVASHRVVDIVWHWFDRGETPHWAARVSIASGPGPLPSGDKRNGSAATTKDSQRVDYREVLSAEDFKRFSYLRAWRKSVAEADGVQLFVVFTNEQLAQITQRNVRTLRELGEIEGVGRGGSWINGARNARSAYRNANHPGNRNHNLGFRFCLSSIATSD